MRSRCLLHKNKLDEFTLFAITEGYRVEPTKGVWEVLRLRIRNEPPLIYYDRIRGDHVTVMRGEPLALVQRYLLERSK